MVIKKSHSSIGSLKIENPTRYLLLNPQMPTEVNIMSQAINTKATIVIEGKRKCHRL
jgi:hypothetical protein